MTLFEIFHIWISDSGSLNVEAGSTLLIVIALVLTLALIVKKLRDRSLVFQETEMSISLGGIGNVRIKANHEVAQIAHKAWSELITRKAGLMFDKDHDLICEVYNSWYQLFKEIRSLIKEIPAGRLKDRNTSKLVNVLVASLNQGLRPHLTQWQARFRRWYENELVKEANKDISPQEIQSKYPHYSEIVGDLEKINKEIVSYTAELKKLIS